MTESDNYLPPDATGAHSPHEDSRFLQLVSADRYAGMVDENPRPRRIEVTINPDAPGGVIVPDHLLVAAEELTESDIKDIYKQAKQGETHVRPDVIEAWRRLELSLCKREDEIGFEERKRALAGAQKSIQSAMNAMGDKNENGDLRILFDISDEYRYLAFANAFAPAYQAQLERRAMRPDEHQEVYTNMGDLLWQSLGEIQRKGLEQDIQNPYDYVRGAFGELVTITASAYPTGNLLYPTPQRGFRHSDVQLPYRDPTGRRVERLGDIKLGEVSGSNKGEPANRIRVGGLAIRAVDPAASPTGDNRAARAWSSLVEVGKFAAADSRGVNLSRTGQTKLDRFAWATARRIDTLNSRTNLTSYLQAA